MSQRRVIKNGEIELDHIGIAVPQIATSSAFWKALGWTNTSADESYPAELVADQKVQVAMLETNNRARVELLEPTDDASTVKKFMDKRGPGIHHLCFRVKNIVEVLKTLKAAGVKLINESPVPGAHDMMVAFVHPSSTGGVLVELSEPKQSVSK